MALWKFTNLNKYGNPRSRIIYRPDGEAFGFNPKGFGPFVNVQMFKYEHKHELIPPALVVSNGKKYIVPTWKEVDPNTTLNDIQWIRPKVKITKSETVVKISKSSSSDVEYTTKYYPDSGRYHCDCPGTWRTRGNCKHVKELRNKIENN